MLVLTVVDVSQALKSLHINIVNFVNHRRTGENIIFFPSHKALVDWTLAKTGRIFPKASVKKDGFLKIFLEHML